MAGEGWRQRAPQRPKAGVTMSALEFGWEFMAVGSAAVWWGEGQGEKRRAAAGARRPSDVPWSEM